MVQDLILEVKNGCGTDSFIPLINIKNEDDKKMGIGFTLDEFKERFAGVDVNHIYYIPNQFISKTIYFDFDKYIYLELPIYGDKVLCLNPNLSEAENIKNQIDNAYKVSSKKDNIHVLLGSMPDSLRAETLIRIVNNGDYKDEVYDIFKSLYFLSDYSFSKLPIETVKKLMSLKTQEQIDMTNDLLSKFDDEIIVYRGEGGKSSHFKDGAYSWTLNINIANFFANRYSTEFSSIYVAKVKKSDVLEAFFNIDEEELLILPENIEVIDHIEFYGADFLQTDLLDANIFWGCKEQLRDLYFPNLEEGVHDKLHSLRVLFLVNVICKHLNINYADTVLLSTASIYHDIGRLNDGVCTSHGERSYNEFFKKDFNDNELMKFLLTYHCKDDEDAIEYLNNCDYSEEKKENFKQLLWILKDADALDRVRFGIKGLDFNSLRFDFSKKLVLIARLSLNGLTL